MARIKIDYGIDLGTTNSAIARIENGEAIIKKTDVLKDTMSSCVGFNKKQSIIAGDSAYNSLKSDRLRALKNWDNKDSNFFIEFKRTMGTDKQHESSHMNRSFVSEELSSEILNKLKSFIKDEDLKSAVVTVPAKFTINQKDATVKAAKLAGLKHCELLQEPIAASMSYGMDSNSKDGFWLVFDFGGGTFDAAIIKSEDGIMQVVDTEGNNSLGGKNLDYAIVDNIIIPYMEVNNVIVNILSDAKKKPILQDAMKCYAEETKIQMSFNETHNILSDIGDIPGEDDEGEELELDITVTQADMQRVLSPIFQRAIDITKELLKRNNLDGNKLGALILVGGPTFSPVLRKMLEEQICKPDVSVDPMTAVAKGAALYASTISVSEEVLEETRDKTKIQLSLGYEATTVELDEFVTVKTLPNKSDGQIPNQVFVELERGDKGWASGKVEINDKGDVIEIVLKEGVTNLFSVILYDEKGNRLESEPKEFTIIQGTKLGSATLPYNIGIAIRSISLGRDIASCIKGLERNTSYPATGIRNALKTQKVIRPGEKGDFIRIGIYEMEEGADTSRPIYNEHVFDTLITGEDLPALLPEGSDVDITIKCIGDGNILLSAYFPYLDHTQDIKYDSSAGVQKEVDADWLEMEMAKAKQTIAMIEREGMSSNTNELNKLSEELVELSDRLSRGRSDYDRKKDVLGNLRQCLRKIDDIQDLTEWPRVEEEIKDVFYRLEEINKEYGNEKTIILVDEFKSQIPELIKTKDVKLANKIIEDMRQLDFILVDQGMGANFEIGHIYHLNEEFDTLDWSDRSKARMLINQGISIAASNPTKQVLRPILIELFKLLPVVTEGPDSGIPKDILRD